MPTASDDAASDDADGLEIRAVLDASALASYAQGHIHVGELLVLIGEEGASVGVPATSLFAAHAAAIGAVDERARLAVLVALPGVLVLDLGVEVAEAACDYVPAVGGDLGVAHAVWVAVEHLAYYVTTRPEQVAAALPAEQIHAIPATDI